MKKFIHLAVLFSVLIFSGCAGMSQSDKAALNFNLPQNYNIEYSGKIDTETFFLIYSRPDNDSSFKALIGKKDEMTGIMVSSVTRLNGNNTIETSRGKFYFPTIASGACSTFNGKTIEVTDRTICKITS